MTMNRSIREQGECEKTGVNLITMRMKGHARHSGYDRLTDYIDGNIITGPEEFGFFQKIVARVLKPFTKNSGLYWYHRESLIAELSAARRWIKAREEVFHFLYGENSFRYLGEMKKLKKSNVVLSTFHTPPDKFSRVVDDFSHLEILDAIIIMSTMQARFFEKIVGKDKVFFVPHGVDVDYFRPTEREKQKGDTLRCLLVGSHLRDFETFSAAARKIYKLNPFIKFTVVTPEANYSYFSGAENVELLSGISDDMLLGLYQNADIFVLPLQECTANNVLLEAMACGAPVIATDLQGVRDYANEKCAVLVEKGDAKKMVNALMEVAEDTERRNIMRIESRKRSLDFEWDKIARQLCQVYEKALIRR